MFAKLCSIVNNFCSPAFVEVLIYVYSQQTRTNIWQKCVRGGIKTDGAFHFFYNHLYTHVNIFVSRFLIYLSYWHIHIIYWIQIIMHSLRKYKSLYIYMRKISYFLCIAGDYRELSVSSCSLNLDTCILLMSDRMSLLN